MLELQRTEQLQTAFHEMDSVVFKGYLENITNFSLIPVETTLDQAITKIRLRKVARIIYDRDENILDKFNSVFSSLHSCDSSVVLILRGSKSHTDLYIGTNKISSDISFSGGEAMETLDAAFNGNFPGIDLKTNLVAQEINKLLEPLQGQRYSSIASVAGVPSLKNNDADSFSQGLEKIIDGMRGREYTAVIQASPISRRELEHVEGAYQDIHSALSLFEQKQISLSVNESRAIGATLTEGITKTLSQSVGATQTNTTGTSTSTSTSLSKTQSDIDIKRALSQIASGAATGAVFGSAAGGIGAAPGAFFGGLAGLSSGVFGGSKSTSESTSESTNTSNSTAHSTTNSSSDSTSDSRSDSDTSTAGTGKSIQITEKNRRVTAMLSAIDNQLERIDECRNYGMWSWGAYFIGTSELDVKLGADLYSGILRGETSGLERNSIALWNKQNDAQNFKKIQKYIAQLKHPVFKTPDNFVTQVVSHTSLISTREMTVAMSLPQKSLPGIPVFDSVAFGRSITHFESQAESDVIRVGSISNFGSVDENNAVKINTKSLLSHTFITGSTGAGKSNVIYSILNTLYTKKKIPFLIIEPAKGEYKQIFGGRKDVHVFGTNPKLTPLIRLNPFSFPEEIHVMEHIDRLIEILNAVWPMYAAMPAILKEAVEYTYEKLGWDLLNSECKHDEVIFPDFHDLLEILPDIINKSDYSQELKGNYIGALVTRIRSLTNGYFKTIFQKDEITPAQLFDEACIVDLSRIGSSETKSLLMGILFLKLQEYRMANATGANAELRHITVLEEAHNLLRRTSSAQSQDSSNLQGKSVEMISNAIAEMRTYGEGFIIADQAPALLDQSVIRNTNTKIILRLPDFDDRNLVGKAAHLNEEQIDELARLKTGCAAIYQNDWLESVLCQFERFEDAHVHPFVYQPESVRLVDSRKQSLTDYIKILVNISLNCEGEIGTDDLTLVHTNPYFFNSSLPAISSKEDLCKTVSSTLNLIKILDRVPKVPDLDSWIQNLAREVVAPLDKEIMNIQEQHELLKIVLNAIAYETPHNKVAFDRKIAEIESGNGIAL